MRNFFLKKLLFVAPVIILIAMLFFINYIIGCFKDSTYTFVFEANTCSIEHFAREMSELVSDYNTIQAYNKTVGGKYSVFTFLLDKDGNIHHSNYENKQYLVPLLENPDNMYIINQEASARDAGEFYLESNGRRQKWFQHALSDGTDEYHIFMMVDRKMIGNRLNANEIVIPISVMGLLLLISIENTIWLTVICEKTTEKKEVG